MPELLNLSLREMPATRKFISATCICDLVPSVMTIGESRNKDCSVDGAEPEGKAFRHNSAVQSATAIPLLLLLDSPADFQLCPPLTREQELINSNLCPFIIGYLVLHCCDNWV